MAARNQDTDGSYTFKWLAAWAIFFTMVGLADKTRMGHRLIFHSLVLIMAVLLLRQYKVFAQLEEPISGVKLTPTGK